jgi:hypothetical protein
LDDDLVEAVGNLIKRLVRGNVRLACHGLSLHPVREVQVIERLRLVCRLDILLDWLIISLVALFLLDGGVRYLL